MMTNNNHIGILEEIHFGYIGRHRAAGMAEPWRSKLWKTFALLEDAGIGAVLTLTEDDLYGRDYEAFGFMHLHAPVNDCEAPSSGVMDKALMFIDSALREGKGVVAHCLEGRGRTGTVLCAWLAVKEALDPEAAVKRIHELRPHTVLSESQRNFLREYIPKRRGVTNG